MICNHFDLFIFCFEMKIKANIVDLHLRKIFPAEVEIFEQKISKIAPLPADETADGYLLPGFVDAHVHIESSMLVPSEFAKLAVRYGTVATVSDPHEIANVLGTAGVEFMLDDARLADFKFHFGAPSCVPATNFETAGAAMDAAEIERLLRRDDIFYLSEMMNFPGVLHDDPQVVAKIEAAHRLGKPVDGHAPALRGEPLRKYFAAGISTDHECFTHAEALEKLELGMKILIREGSAAKNFEALIDLLPRFPEKIMFCSDDKHPDDLLRGHINQLVVRALRRGCDLFEVLRAACLNPVEHYRLPVGLLREGNFADFILVENLSDFRVLKTFVNGKLVFDCDALTALPSTESRGLVKSDRWAKAQSDPADGALAQRQPITNPRLSVEGSNGSLLPNQFNTQPKHPEDFKIEIKTKQVRAIRAFDGEIVTGAEVADFQKDKSPEPHDWLQKIAVVNRYFDAPVAVGFIKGFGLKTGALASCVAHDSHNIVAVGCDDEAISRAVNLVIEQRGGISAVGFGEEKVLPLPVAGIMSDAAGEVVAAQYSEIDRFVREVLGSPLGAPFMTLSFMALPVIPSLKMTDKGLFDVDKFEFS